MTTTTRAATRSGTTEQGGIGELSLALLVGALGLATLAGIVILLLPIMLLAAVGWWLRPLLRSWARRASRSIRRDHADPMRPDRMASSSPMPMRVASAHGR